MDRCAALLGIACFFLLLPVFSECSTKTPLVFEGHEKDNGYHYQHYDHHRPIHHRPYNMNHYWYRPRPYATTTTTTTRPPAPVPVWHYPETACICVSHYQCTHGNIDSDGAGLLDPRTHPTFRSLSPSERSNKCYHPHTVCCPIVHHVKDTTTTPTTTTTKDPYDYYHWGCGIRNHMGLTDARILNPSHHGVETRFGEFPWQAAITKSSGGHDVFVCGGTLVHSRFVVTSAHCVNEMEAADLRVRLGEWDTKSRSERYPCRDFHVDKLDAYAPHAPHIIPACLPLPDQDFIGLDCIVTGWGKDAHGKWGQYQTILKKVEVPVISSSSCQQKLRTTRLGSKYVLDSGFLCAGGESGKDACKGDGGGPLVCKVDGVYQLAGVVSWGIGCGDDGVPGVYVNIPHYITWIVSIIEKMDAYDTHEHLYSWGRK